MSKGVLRSVIVLTVVLIAGLVAPSSGAARSDRTPLPLVSDRALFAAAERMTALETPANLGHGARIVFFGDSLGGDVAAGLRPAAAARGATVVQDTVPGCSSIDGLLLLADGSTISWGPTCLNYLNGRWRAKVAATPADAVVWLSSLDGASRVVDGVVVDTATPEGRQRMAELIIETANIIAPPGSGRRVVLILPSANAPNPSLGAPDPASAVAVRRHRAIQHLVVQSDPSRFSMVRLDQFLCPHGAPCPAEPVPGITPRGADGGHLTPEGAAWLAPQLLDALGVT